MAEKVVIGVEGLRNGFLQLDRDIRTRTAARMVVAAGRVMVKQAKSNIKAQGLVKSGAYLRNVAIKKERGMPMGITQYNLGVRHGRWMTKKQKSGVRTAVGRNGRIYRRNDNDPWYWRFAELGTKRIPARPALGPAAEQSRAAATDAMQTELAKHLARAGK